MMEQLRKYLTNSHRILVVSHKNPDGDAVSALIAMGLALESIGKDVTFYNESTIPTVYRFLTGIDRIASRLEAADRFDAAVILDCAGLERIGESGARIGRMPNLINIDHQETKQRFGHVNYVDSHACATTELIYRLVKAWGIALDLPIARAIYTGILTDTGSFRFSNTNPAAFAICAEMTQLGINPYEIARHVYGTYSLGRIKLLNLALDSIEISRNGKLSIMTVTQEMLHQTGTHPEDADGLINYARRIEDVKVAALIQELRNGEDITSVPPRCHVSLRSDGSVNVAAIAATYGGGGHTSAAGFGLEGSIPEVKTKIVKMADTL
jgi:phosphoesterase RecJ-like protein